MAEGREVFRSVGTLLLGAVVTFLVWLLFSLAVIGEGFGVSGILVMANIFAFFVWVELKVVFWRNVSLEDGEVVLRGYWTKTRIGAGRIDRAWVGGGALLIELKNGDILDVSAFRGSIISSIFGSPSASRAAGRIEEVCRSDAVKSDGDRSTSLHLNILYVPVIWIASFVYYWFLSGFVVHW
ncbi:hypothetical protein [Nocardiopsis alba]|uniref:PH domain-containing protein n=1 Tax=Nocardiopsis alba TaxID=53437 RepID=A0A7K2IMB6_9ACTN|nr:hypothetical protein [Nocardiopsis alba]MYR31093.1 hypothetical protein [Nocardiopsis alba]